MSPAAHTDLGSDRLSRKVNFSASSKCLRIRAPNVSEFMCQTAPETEKTFGLDFKIISQQNKITLSTVSHFFIINISDFITRMLNLMSFFWRIVWCSVWIQLFAILIRNQEPKYRKIRSTTF